MTTTYMARMNPARLTRTKRDVRGNPAAGPSISNGLTSKASVEKRAQYGIPTSKFLGGKQGMQIYAMGAHAILNGHVPV